MNLSFIKKILCKNFSLKITSLIIGYGLWYLASQSITIQHTFEVPIAFYNIGDKKIDAPDSVHITLKGKRKALRSIAHTLALHIDAAKVTNKTTTLALTKEDLFLPDSVSLVHYKPTESLITLAC